ncbi:MAG: ABC transporter permease [Gammaproteobacteria bacterium]|nr:ABC transporter permease [Gammaproteobacteria bacterium]
MSSYFETQRDSEVLSLRLSGDWHVAQVAAIEAALAALPLAGARVLQIDASAARFDLSGTWLLRDLLVRVRAAGLQTRFSGPAPDTLQVIDRTLDAASPAPPAPPEPPLAAVAVGQLGRRAVGAWLSVRGALGFIGHTAVAGTRALTSWHRLRPISIVRHVYDTGITAIPIVGLIAFLISVILAYMGAQQLRKFGADVFVVDLVTIGVLRELGVLLTAIIIAGRSGSAFAAEIGAMRLNEEVDALHATGVDPYEVLVLPRILGLVIALPLLTVLADGVGLLGGGLLCHLLLDMPLAQYLNRVQDSIASTTFWVGIAQAPVFAVLIGVSGTWCGLRVRGSSRDLGRLTTLAVVESIFFVIFADALFAVLFMELDI